MKRIFFFLSIFVIASLACGLPATQIPTVETQPTEMQPAQNTEEAGTSPTLTTAPTLLYISGTTHIESMPQWWPNVDSFLNFLQQVTALGMKWSVGADIGWLEGEPRAAELIQASEALGVQWDVHTHSLQDRAKAAYLITQLGGHPNSVVSGMLVSEFSSIAPQTYQGLTWTPQVLWGGTNCPGHRPGCDDLAAGLWMPLSAEQYTTHNPSGQYIRVGGGTHQLDDGLVLAQAIANGEYAYPVISFTVMVSPINLKVVNSEDGIAEITTFVAEINGYHFIRWANIEETAKAWAATGRVPSRIEME